MKRFTIILSIAALLASCTGKEPVYWFDASLEGDGASGTNVPYYPDKPANPVDPDTPQEGYAPDGYKLVWQDEFDSQLTLYQNWWFETGGTGWGNNEAQYYCDSYNGEKTADVSDGTLKIIGRKVEASAATDDKSYISARLNTKATWKYGYFEMKAKLPTTKGCWSAFWMLPDKDQYPSWVRDASMKGGEIDILEYVPGDDLNNIYFSAHSYNATSEVSKTSGYMDPEDTSGNPKIYPYWDKTKIENPSTEWHYFGFLWTHESVHGYLDGKEYYYAPNPNPAVDMEANPNWGFDKPFYIKLNLALGGSWGGTIDPNFTTATYEVDYVRIYQK